jgi:surface protein
MESMFYSCSSLESIIFDNFDTENLVDMRNLFYNCSSLTSIDLSKFNTQYVRYLSKMFYHCSSLSYLDISSFQLNSTNSSLFDENLPKNGKIIIDSIFEPIIKGQIPESWEVEIK